MNATWLDTWARVGAFRNVDRAWAISTRPGTRFVETELATVRVRIEGTASPTILFAADPPNVLEHYDALFAEIAPWARAACVELPNGSSPVRTRKSTTPSA